VVNVDMPWALGSSFSEKRLCRDESSASGESALSSFDDLSTTSL
jgi:hypothetical protein